MAYVYQAEILCDSCGRKIIDLLKSDGKNVIDELDYGSDDFPRYVYDTGETDSPEHCAHGDMCLEAEILPSGRKIGCLINTQLTTEGIKCIEECIEKDPNDELTLFWRKNFNL